MPMTAKQMASVVGEDLSALTALELQHRVSQFLFHEAHLQDTHAYDEWESLWTDDAIYWVPANGLDSDPERVSEAAAAGEPVSYGDCARRETLVTAGVVRAHVLIVTFSDSHAVQRVLHHVRDLRPDLPVVVRAHDDADMERFAALGATEVVPEALESSVMLATHALALLGIPMHRVIKRLREMREQHYVLLRGFFHGATDAADHLEEADQPRLHAVLVTDGAKGAGRPADELGLVEMGVQVSAVRRRGATRQRVDLREPLAEGDVVVLLGTPKALKAAEERILRGK